MPASPAPARVHCVPQFTVREGLPYRMFLGEMRQYGNPPPSLTRAHTTESTSTWCAARPCVWFLRTLAYFCH